MHVITQSLSAFPQNRKDDPNRCRHTGCLKCPRGLAWAGWGERWRIWVFAIWCPQLQTRPRWVGTKYEVPPYRKDKVSLEMLLAQPQVEPNCLGPCLESRKNGQSPKICRALVPGRTKYGSHYKTRCTQKGTRKQSWFIQKIFPVGQNITHNLTQANRVKRPK